VGLVGGVLGMSEEWYDHNDNGSVTSGDADDHGQWNNGDDRTGMHGVSMDTLDPSTLQQQRRRRRAVKQSQTVDERQQVEHDARRSFSAYAASIPTEPARATTGQSGGRQRDGTGIPQVDRLFSNGDSDDSDDMQWTEELPNLDAADDDGYASFGVPERSPSRHDANGAQTPVGPTLDTRERQFLQIVKMLGRFFDVHNTPVCAHDCVMVSELHHMKSPPLRGRRRARRSSNRVYVSSGGAQREPPGGRDDWDRVYKSHEAIYQREWPNDGDYTESSDMDE